MIVPRRRPITVSGAVLCGREKDGGQVMVGMGIGDQGLVAVEDSRVGHYKKSLIPGTTGYYRV